MQRRRRASPRVPGACVLVAALVCSFFPPRPPCLGNSRFQPPSRRRLLVGRGAARPPRLSFSLPRSYAPPSLLSLIEGMAEVAKGEGRGCGSAGKPLAAPIWLSPIDFVRVRGQTNTCYRGGWLRRKGGRACDRARWREGTRGGRGQNHPSLPFSRLTERKRHKDEKEGERESAHRPLDTDEETPTPIDSVDLGILPRSPAGFAIARAHPLPHPLPPSLRLAPVTFHPAAPVPVSPPCLSLLTLALFRASGSVSLPPFVGVSPLLSVSVSG